MRLPLPCCRATFPPMPLSLAFRGRRLTPSAVALIVANLVPLAGVLFLGWTLFATLLLFWLENVTVGVFSVLQLLAARPREPLAWGAKVLMVPFFMFHYGM